MRGQLLAVVGLCGACISGGHPPRERDDGTLRVIAQQERWAQQAIDARPTPEQLDRIRQSDFQAVNSGRRELQRLMQAIDRGTWVRDRSVELLRQDPTDRQMLQEFDRGGRLRTDALHAADELASALADARGGLTQADLRPGLDAVRKAQASEDRLSTIQGQNGLRLTAAPIPVPRPFSDASNRLASAGSGPVPAGPAASPPPVAPPRPNAETERAEEERNRTPPPMDDNRSPGISTAEPQGTEAEAPSTTLSVAADAAQLLSKRVPRSITLREDGLFQLSYDDGDYLVRPDGKLVRKEPRANR